MIKSFVKNLIVVLTLALTSFATYLLCYYIAEKYFFDKFFFFKSIAHGYFPPHSQNADFGQYGDRGRDIDIISDSTKSAPKVSAEDNRYKIAIFGDSLVWGQGLRNSQRFAKLLEDRLEDKKPTRVYSFGNSGDNIFDAYQKYKLAIEKFGKMDLYIFGLYNNDLVFNKDDRYLTQNFVNQNLLPNCPGEVIYDPFFDEDNLGDFSFYTTKVGSLSPNTANYCAYKKLAKMFPSGNIIFIDLGSIEGEHEAQNKFAEVIKHDFNIIKLDSLNYQKYRVSGQEGHPSAYANQIFSNRLYQEITDDHKYHFLP